MGVSDILAILTFLIKSEPALAEWISEIFGYFGPPTDQEMLAQRIAEYMRVAVPAWVAVWNLDYGAGELGNVERRHFAVKEDILRYARDWKNEILTEAQADGIVTTARGLATFQMAGVPTERPSHV